MFPLLFVLVYVVGVFVIGVPMGFLSIRLWRGRNGKKDLSFALLFPVNYRVVGYRALTQGYGTYELGRSLLHMMVSESALLNSACEEDAESRLTCARYVFVSALAWPLRCAYLLVMLVMLETLVALANAFWELFVNILPTMGGKLLLKSRCCTPF